MASKRGTSIIDWLSEVEASGNTQEASLSGATPSPSSSPSASSSPSLAGLLPPRKRKLDPGDPKPSTEILHLVKRTRKALRQIMQPHSSKRSRGDTASENDAQRVELEGERSTSSQVNLQTPEPGRPSTSSQSNLKTPSITRTRAPPALAINVHNTRNALARNGMWYDDQDAFDKYSALKDMVDAIISNGLRSEMADTSAKKVMAAVKKNYTQNEKTVFRKVQPLVVKLTRKVAEQENSEVGGGIEIIKKEFKEDGLEVIEDCNFTRRLLPLPESFNDKDMGLTEPKPDFTYGHVEPELPPDYEYHVPKELQACLGVAPLMRYPFYVEELKSVEEGIAKAEHQAMRDGATLVNARRKLNQALQPAGYVSPPGADVESFVFSCAWTPDIARLYVNWYEKQENGREIYHMTKLHGSGCQMDRKDDVKLLRHDIHNILDWGLLTHRPKAQEVWEGIVKLYLQKYNSSKAGG